MRLSIRQATMDDKKDVMEFVSRIWHGNDYIPKVWDKWLQDSSGRIHVIELDGKVVGMNRIKFLADGYCWLQGARIHPDYMGRGLATILGRYVIEWAERQGYRKFRLSCAVNNFPAIAQVRKMGFREISRMSVYLHKRKKKNCVRLEIYEDIAEILEAVKSTKEYKLSSGVLWDSYIAMSINEKILEDFVKNKTAFGYNGSVCLVKNGMEEERRILQVCFIGGRVESVDRICDAVIGMSEEKMFFIPQKSSVISVLREKGAEREGSFILFERSIAKS